MKRTQIEQYMAEILGYEQPTIDNYRKLRFSRADLLNVVQSDLDDQPDDFWAGNRHNAEWEVTHYNGTAKVR